MDKIHGTHWISYNMSLTVTSSAPVKDDFRMVSPTIPIIRGLHHWPTYPPPRASSSRATLSALTEAARQRDEARPNLEATRTAQGLGEKMWEQILNCC